MAGRRRGTRRLKRPRKGRYTPGVGAKGFALPVGRKPDPKAIGAELRKLRVFAGVTTVDLADRMGWISQNLSRLERGGDGREPTLSSINRYLRALGYELVLTARPKPPLRESAGDDEEPRPETRGRSAIKRSAGENDDNE